MATSLGGWFDKVFFDAHGEPCASGELRFYQTGTDIPQGVATFDGTPLGSVIRLDDDGRPESDFRFYTDKIYRVVLKDADGVVVKTIDGVAIPEGEGGGMYNPMAAEGDLIVGSTDGEPARLGVGSAGEVLTSDGTTWVPAAIPTQTGDHKVSADGTDTAPGYLIDKLYAGNNVSIEAFLDGAVRKVKVSATGGGGGGGGSEKVISSGFMGWFSSITSLSATSHALFLQTFFPPFNTLKSVRAAFNSATHIPTDLEVGVYRTNWNGDFLLISKTVAAEQTYSQGVSQEYVFPTPVDISSYKNDGITIVLYCGRVNNTGYLWPGSCGTSSPSNTKICAYKNNASGGCPSTLPASGLSAVAGFFMTLTGE